jgi:hypothetical protein
MDLIDSEKIRLNPWSANSSQDKCPPADADK